MFMSNEAEWLRKGKMVKEVGWVVGMNRRKECGYLAFT